MWGVLETVRGIGQFSSAQENPYRNPWPNMSRLQQRFSNIGRSGTAHGHPYRNEKPSLWHLWQIIYPQSGYGCAQKEITSGAIIIDRNAQVPGMSRTIRDCNESKCALPDTHNDANATTDHAAYTNCANRYISGHRWETELHTVLTVPIIYSNFVDQFYRLGGSSSLGMGIGLGPPCGLGMLTHQFHAGRHQWVRCRRYQRGLRPDHGDASAWKGRWILS